MKELKEQLRTKKFRNLYLFCGEEEYLKNYYTNEIIKNIISDKNDKINYLKLNQKFDLSLIDNFVFSPPFFNDKKILVIKNSGMFKKISESDKEIIINVLDNINDDVIIVFDETEIDKRGVLYKKINTKGKVITFDYQKEVDLKNWILRILASFNMKMLDNDILYFLAICQKDMNTIMSEITKLCFYKKNDGVINREDIDKSVPKSVENRVFQMIDNAVMGNAKLALEMFMDLKTLDEPPERILVNVSNEYLKIRKTKLMFDKYSKNDIASQLKIPPFYVSNYIQKAKKLDMNKINNMIKLCKDTDYFIKNGVKEKWSALENLIIQSQI